MSAEELLSLSEAGRRCNPPLQHTSIRRAIDRGRLRGVAVGDTYKVPASAVAEFDATRQVNTAPTAEVERESVAELQRQNLQARTAKEEALAHKARLEAAALAGELLYREDVVELWADTIARSRAKLLGLPTRLAAVLSGGVVKTPAQIERIASAIVAEALGELAAYEHDQYASTARRRRKRVANAETANEGAGTGGGSGKAGDGAVGAATGVHGKPVGGKRAEAKPRKQRGGGGVAERADAVPGGHHGRGGRPEGRARSGDGGGADGEDGGTAQRNRVPRRSRPVPDVADTADGGDGAGRKQGPHRADDKGHTRTRRKSD